MSNKASESNVHLPRPPTVTKKMGRPPKLTLDVQQRIINAMRTGCYLETAAAHVNVSPQALREWLRRGADGKSKPHRDFLSAIEKVEADAELMDLKTIGEFGLGLTVTIVKRTTKANGDIEETIETRPVREWTAAAWRLERRHPAKWGRRVELRGKDGSELKAGLVQIYLPDNGRAASGSDEADTAANRLAAIGGNGGNGGGNGKPHPGGNGDGQ